MQIHNLPAQTTAADADVLAIDNGTTTQKITAANLKKKMIGTTDISSLSTDGTVTGALAKLNTDLGISKITLTASNVTSNVGEVQTGAATEITVRYDNRMMYVNGVISLASVTTNDKVTITISGLPTEKYENPGGCFAYVCRRNTDGLFSLGDYALVTYDRTDGVITLAERNYMAVKAVPAVGYIQVVIPGIILFAR